MWTTECLPLSTPYSTIYHSPEASSDSGPASTIWAKPLVGGRIALLTINGADTPQPVTLDFGSLGKSLGKYLMRMIVARMIYVASKGAK